MVQEVLADSVTFYFSKIRPMVFAESDVHTLSTLDYLFQVLHQDVKSKVDLDIDAIIGMAHQAKARLNSQRVLQKLELLHLYTK